MTSYPARRAASLVRRLERLNDQVERVRVELSRCGPAAPDVPPGVAESEASRLREANEQLVLAALHAETVAETAMNDLRDLARTSQLDSLTDLPNRTLMLDRMRSAIFLARRHSSLVGVLFIDLDGFKQINDAYGHAIGDELLQLVARRLESAVRDSDTVSRHSGDEFLVLLTELSSASDAGVVAGKILSVLAAPEELIGNGFQPSASIGIAICPADGDDAETLIHRADLAMYRAKQRYGCFAFHTPEMSLEDRALAGPSASTRRQKSRAEASAHQMREANAELTVAALDAQERWAAATEGQRRQVNLVTTLVHELRNPLAPIRAAVTLLKRVQTEGPLLARVQGILERQVGHLSRLVDDLLDESRITTGRFHLESAEVEMATVFNQVVEACAPAIERRDQRLTLRLPAAPLPVYGDAGRLVQMFTNVLDNASKYTPLAGSIELVATIDGDSLVVVVSDNGIGITAKALPAVFDSFVREKRGRDFTETGLGVGLAIVRELAEAHGGTVTAASAGIGQGSRFTVTLPLIEPLVEQHGSKGPDTEHPITASPEQRKQNDDRDGNA